MRAVGSGKEPKIKIRPAVFPAAARTGWSRRRANQRNRAVVLQRIAGGKFLGLPGYRRGWPKRCRHPLPAVSSIYNDGFFVILYFLLHLARRLQLHCAAVILILIILAQSLFMKKFTLAHLMLAMGIGILAINLTFNHFFDVPTVINYFFRGSAMITVAFGFLGFRLVVAE